MKFLFARRARSQAYGYIYTMLASKDDPLAESAREDDRQGNPIEHSNGGLRKPIWSRQRYVFPRCIQIKISFDNMSLATPVHFSSMSALFCYRRCTRPSANYGLPISTRHRSS